MVLKKWLKSRMPLSETWSAVEGLGCVSVICSDNKTGTLTQNKMKVREKFTEMESATRLSVLTVMTILFSLMLLCTDAAFSADGESIGDPTETALIEFFGKERCDKVRSAQPRGWQKSHF